MADASNETTMEDILASIKKIISEDTNPAPRADVPEAIPESVRPHKAAQDDVLHLTGALREPPMEQASPVASGSEPMLSSETARATRQAFENLTMAVEPRARGATLEELASDLLRPMLKDWLDTNLPALVERLVSQEVARVSGRA